MTNQAEKSTFQMIRGASLLGLTFLLQENREARVGGPRTPFEKVLSFPILSPPNLAKEAGAMSAMWYIFWNGPVVGAAILASVGVLAILASWLTKPMAPLRYGLRRIGMWLITFGIVFPVVVWLLVMLPGPLDNPKNGVSLDICILFAIFAASGLLAKIFPGFYGEDTEMTHY
ncbi:TPA: hypothetical protein DHW58_00910 [Patescibacteria group bacterium]|nr:hypothetical protein [Patescibacteria group bacterium]